jgi:hypothetical protein
MVVLVHDFDLARVTWADLGCKLLSRAVYRPNAGPRITPLFSEMVSVAGIITGRLHAPDMLQTR